MNFWQKIEEKLRAWNAQHGCTCDACGAEVFSYPIRRLCEECEEKLVKNVGNRSCEKCGRKTLAEGLCLDCKRQLPAFTRGFSAFVYGGEASALVNRFKQGKRRLAWFLGEKMSDTFFTAWENLSQKEGEEELIILPVPTTESVLKSRGFNQAAELVKVVEKRLVERGVRVRADYEILQKRKETPQQKHLDFFKRMQNVLGAYHVHKRKECQGKIILLVDDIMTTGATSNECAKRLFGAGAKKVYFLVSAALPEKK